MSTEFPYEFPLFKGLRPEKYTRDADLGFAEVLTDIKPSPFGLRGLETISDPSDLSPSIAFPFPQLFRGERITLVLGATTVHSVDESDWSTTALSVFDGTTPGSGGTITSGGVWHLATFDNLWVATNGSSIVYRLPSNASDKVLEVSSVTAKAVHGYGNRLYLGGLAGAQMTSNNWVEFVNLWRANQDQVTIHDDELWGTNWVLWSGLHGDDYEWPFTLVLSMLGYPDATEVAKVKGAILTAIEQRSIGMLPLPSQGDVQVIKGLGNHFVVYTTDGVFRVIEGLPLRVHESGVSVRGAVGGTAQQHIFVDNDGVLWQLDSEGKERLGYSEYLSALGSDVVISFDPDQGDYHITDGTVGYILTPSGLCKTSEFPTGLVRSRANGLVGYSAGSTASTFSATSGATDLGNVGLKSVGFLEVQSHNVTSLKAALDFRYGSTSAYVSQALVFASPEGRVYLGVDADEFKLRLSGAAGVEAKLERIIAKFSYADSRTVRGPRGRGSGQVQTA